MEMIDPKGKHTSQLRTIGNYPDYEIMVDHTGLPYVKSKTSGRFFYLPWVALISLAIKSGIDEESSDE